MTSTEQAAARFAHRLRAPVLALMLFLGLHVATGCGDSDGNGPSRADGPAVADGRQIFRHDTFGSERFWTETLRMHEVIQSGISPKTALAAGLKVDADALPPGILGTADLDNPATTVELLRLGAVVGIEGSVQDGQLSAVGVTCALCHSTVNDSVTPGIGQRLDGHANRDLDPGLILSLSPALQDPESQADAWCTLCLASAIVSLVMIGPAMDEFLASLQHLKRASDEGMSLWRAFWGLSATA